MITFVSESIKSNFQYLHPLAKDKIGAFFNELLSLGYEVIVTSSFRPFYREYEIAKQYNSPHTWGMAVDINVRIPKSGNCPNGVYLSMDAETKPLWLKSGIIDIATKKYNLFWGGFLTGRWANDLVHFDCRNYLKLGNSSFKNAKTRLNEWDTKGLEGGVYKNCNTKKLSDWTLVNGYLIYFRALNNELKDGLDKYKI